MLFYKKNIFFLLLILISFSAIYGQKKRINVDSVFISIQSLPDSPEKVDKLLSLFKKSELFTRPDIVEEALDISKKIYYIEGIAKAYDSKGYVERKRNNFLKSVEFHKRALGFFSETNDTVAKMKCLNNLGVSFRKLNYEKEAYKYYMQAYELAKKTHNNVHKARVLNGIGNVFVNTEEYDKALYYFEESLKIEKKSNRLKGREYNLANIGEVYIYLKQFDSAQVYLNKALDVAKKIYPADRLGIEYNLLGFLHKNKKDFKQSIIYYDKALPMLEKYNVKRYISNTLINRGLCNINLNNKNKALQDINKGLSIAKEINSKENISLGYNALVSYYKHIGKYDKALEAHILSTKFHDSIINVTSKNSIISTQIIYETKEKDEKIRQLALEKELQKKKSRKDFLTLIGTIIISFLILVFIYMFFNLRRRNADLELAQKNSEIQNYIMRIKELEEFQNEENNTFDIAQLKDFDLTKREKKVLEFISNGFSNDEIGEKMHISKNTVKSHIRNLYAKLEVKSRNQIIKKLKSS